MADITLRILGQEPLPLNLGSDNSETLSVGSGVTEGRLQEVLTDYVPKSDIDDTLSISGDVAEAKATGDAIAEINSKLADILPSDSASGSIASFPDGANNFPLKSLEVEIEPKQSGSGTPSPDNVRPISGWNETNVVRCGKNLLKVSDIVNITNNGVKFASYDGGIKISETATGMYPQATAISYAKRIPIGAEVTISQKLIGDVPSGAKVYFMVKEYDGAQTINHSLRDNPKETFTVTLPKQSAILVAEGNGLTYDNLMAYLQCEAGEESTDYVPYNGITKTISLGSTYYGGILNVDSGVLTVTHLMNTFTGASNENWTKSTSTAVDRYLCLTSDIFDNANGTAISNIYPQTNYGGTLLNRFYFDNSNNTHRIAVNFAPAGTTSATDIKTFLSSNNLTVVGKLATPITVPLTPTEIKTLLGDNNIFADSGDVSVVYSADIAKYIDKRLGA